MMRKHILLAIQQHAAEVYPEECCGLVVKDGRAHRYIPCKNTHTKPTEYFRISPEEYVVAESTGEIMFVVHSHPDATTQPSPADEALCEESGLPWVIISWPEGDVRMIAPKGDVPIVGRPFVHGVWDCFGLIRDWYKQELGIDLPNFERVDGWWENGDNLYIENYAAAGFVSHDSELRLGDVIFMQYQAPVVNHAGVYLGGGMMLHHLYGQSARVVPYGGIWQERTIKKLRHRDAIDIQPV